MRSSNSKNNTNGSNLPAEPLFEKSLRPTQSILDNWAVDLSVPVEVIRDPLHRDIRLTALEKEIMDSPAFQRLKLINQLGLTYFVYPGALHTRFLHSLGVLHVCEELIGFCNENARIYQKSASSGEPTPALITSYPHVLARLAALIHDCAHIPFGHSLEREARVIVADEWNDPYRVERVFDHKEFGLRNVIKAFCAKETSSEELADLLVNDLRALLTSTKENVAFLPYPFVHDLVGNTICADLIDYVQRDSFFCGLEENFGTRFLRYVAVVPVRLVGKKYKTFHVQSPGDGSLVTAFATRYASSGDVARVSECCRIALLAYRYTDGRRVSPKRGVLTEAIDLVRRRYNVAEKIYFHRTKAKATAMLSQAFYDAHLKVDKVWNMSDWEVIRYLENFPIPQSNQEEIRRIERVRTLASRVSKRDLYKTIFRVSYHPEEKTAVSDRLWSEDTGLHSKYSSPQARTILIDKLEQILALKMKKPNGATGSVVISCPERAMNMKQFMMQVLPEPKSVLTALQNYPDRLAKAEIAAIQEAHLHLWRFEVYVDELVLRECDKSLGPYDVNTETHLSAILEYEFKIKNELPMGDQEALSADFTLRSLNIDLIIEEIIPKGTYVKHEDRQVIYHTQFDAQTEDEIRKSVRAILTQHGYLPQ